jgi:hypothetical protein
VYIEPTVLLPSPRGTLLAGRPNYLVSTDTSAPLTVVPDSVFGAIIDDAGNVSLIPAPVSAPLIAATKGIVMPDGRWAFVFAELRQPVAHGRPDSTAHLWFGEFDGRRWSVLEQLPALGPGNIRLDMGSQLVVRGDTVYAAAPYDSDSLGIVAVVFQRHDARWSAEIVDTERSAAYVELIDVPSQRLSMAVVQPDPALRRDGNSLLLYIQSPRWMRQRSVIPGAAQRVHHPTFTGAGTEGVLTWWATDRATGIPIARAMIGLSANQDGRTLELDPVAAWVTPVFGSGPFPMWVVDHAQGNAHWLRVLGESRGVARELLAVPSPYTGFFAAAAVSSAELLISGPLFHADPARPRLVSLLIRARVECSGSAP